MRKKERNVDRDKEINKNNGSRGSITKKKNIDVESLDDKSFENNYSNITDNEYEVVSETQEKKTNY